MGAFAQTAERLLERGYAAVPIIPGTKRPGIFSGGRWIGLAKWQTRYNGRAPSATEIARWSAGDTGIGVIGGAASHGMVALDIDTDDPAIRTALARIIPGTRVRKIGRRGETLFFHAPHVTESKRWLTASGEVICA
jgi:hypothetical protein